MISKAKIKYISSLEQKKFRRQENAFVTEGPKVVGDLLATNRFAPRLICALPEWIENNYSSIPAGVEICEVTPDELRKVSFLQHPQQVLAVFDIPSAEISSQKGRGDLILALDNVQDPGNLGTIIRIADWFGISDVICSAASADCYNPKVVQATMGSLARVNVNYTDLPQYLSSVSDGTQILGTFLDGEDISRYSLPRDHDGHSAAIIVMGNEGNGISPEVERYVNKRILIPNYPEGRPTADSLNVAIATAITVYHFRSQ